MIFYFAGNYCAMVAVSTSLPLRPFSKTMSEGLVVVESGVEKGGIDSGGGKTNWAVDFVTGEPVYKSWKLMFG